ncbi:hypothetical protein FPV67DRAFT_426137 [Lyophyllum atratum]|nr:hypothetical protein FPV67DRAFT_426137 [Lyophyllum atratum]
MGNVNEPSADGVPGEHEDSPPDAQESSSYDVSGQLRANITSEVTLLTPEQRLQHNPDTGDLGSQPPSRVLIHEEDSTNVWIPLPDAMATQPSVELDTDVAPDSANSSFPLSDSELPETFDASVNHVDLSDFFVCPVASDLKISVNDQKASILCAEAETVKVAQGELLMEPPLIDFEHDLRPSSVPSVSAAIRASVLSGDAPCFIPKHQELNMSEQFSRLESTMSDILSSPVPVYPAVMGQILEVPITKHVPVSAKSQHSVQAPQSSKFGHPATTREETQISTPPLLNDLPIIVNTYADATNVSLSHSEYPFSNIHP